ncbi:MAG: hypothetical protein COB02_16805 [Candidatus Cloacimonadota bacterium]|nr:MAG: hypothetical protein COB02_16805 [Candidatus Cloacimonadota bacterium]
MKAIILQTLDTQRDNIKSQKASKKLELLLLNEKIIDEVKTESCILEINELSDSIKKLSLTTDLLITIGGTGLGLDDCTPEASKKVFEKDCPGIAELMRSETAKLNKKAWISRYVSGIYQNTLIVNFPGKESAVAECYECASDIILHTTKMLCKLK